MRPPFISICTLIYTLVITLAVIDTELVYIIMKKVRRRFLLAFEVENVPAHRTETSHTRC